MSDWKVEIGLNSTGLDSGLQKAQANVGNATTNLGRSIAAGIGQSMGPWGEAVEKANVFIQQIKQISGLGKVMTGTIGIGMVATLFLVHKAIEAYEKMQDAIKEVTRSQQGLNDVLNQFPDTVKRGIDPSQKENAIKQRDKLVADYESQLKEPKLVPVFQQGKITKGLFADNPKYYSDKSEDSDGNVSYGARSRLEAKINALKALDFEKSAQVGGKKNFENAAGSDALRLIESERNKKFTNSIAANGSDGLQLVRDELSKQLLNMPESLQGGESAKILAEEIKKLDDSIKTLTEQEKESIKAWEVEVDSLVKAKDEADSRDKEFSDSVYNRIKSVLSSSQTKDYELPKGYGVGGLTSVGGGNPIYFGSGMNTQKEANKYLDKIEQNTRQRPLNPKYGPKVF